MSISRYFIPVLVIAGLFGGYFLRAAFTQPSTQVEFAGRQNTAKSATVTCIVEGVKCKGTANFFTRLYDGAPGIIAIETYASEHKAVIVYNPRIITPEGIKAVMEQPLSLQDGSSRQVFKCLSMK